MVSVCSFKKFLCLSFILTLFFPAPSGFSSEKTIQIKGSDTMVNLGQSWAEAFMETHPEVSIAVTGGGSGTGVASILSGTCDIAQSSRDLTPEEKAKAQASGSPITETVVGYDGIAVVTHPANPVNQLTTDQLADIFSGKVQNWKEVGGNDSPILILSRERNSGTHVFFLEHIVRRGNAKGPEEFAPSTLMMPSSQAIVTEIKSSEAAIGYVGLGYVDEQIKVISVGKTAEGPFMTPDIEDVLNGSYAIARPLLFLTRGELSESSKQFVDFVVGPDGQEIVEALDFVPLKK
jgi:phosphate transport system substrate-binding protein